MLVKALNWACTSIFDRLIVSIYNNVFVSYTIYRNKDLTTTTPKKCAKYVIANLIPLGSFLKVQRKHRDFNIERYQLQLIFQKNNWKNKESQYSL